MVGRFGLLVPRTVSLRQQFPVASFVGTGDLCVTHVTHDPTNCTAGSMLAVFSREPNSRDRLAAEAHKAGAKSLLVERPIGTSPLPQCVVPCVRVAYSRLALALAGNPQQHLKLLGVTGTNGKTTVAWIVRHLLNHSGRQCGLLGTIEYHDGLTGQSAALTTPDSTTLARWLARMVTAGTDYAALEVSSHALAQDRVAGIELQAAAVTNITRDHLDYHGTLADYRAAKSRILNLVSPGGIVALNAHDASVASLEANVPAGRKTVFFGTGEQNQLSATVHSMSLAGSSLQLTQGGDRVQLGFPLFGAHNVMNLLAAIAMVQSVGMSLAEVASAVSSFVAPPGRLEPVRCGQPFEVFVDYAHTDDALRNVLSALKPHVAGRLHCVFGAGGDRDRSKRPLLGDASMLADEIVITSDNPRSEDPRLIAEEIRSGIDPTAKARMILDRAEAIHTTLKDAQQGDCILIAGKGHETEQVIGQVRNPFDDRLAVRDSLARLGFNDWNTRRSA
jgi:UDP-N-acetylmuramoyl-L-alanyl-D-glutamate--2,6-diaminopimelate ligase